MCIDTLALCSPATYAGVSNPELAAIRRAWRRTSLTSSAARPSARRWRRMTSWREGADIVRRLSKRGRELSVSLSGATGHFCIGPSPAMQLGARPPLASACSAPWTARSCPTRPAALSAPGVLLCRHIDRARRFRRPLTQEQWSRSSALEGARLVTSIGQLTSFTELGDLCAVSHDALTGTE